MEPRALGVLSTLAPWNMTVHDLGKNDKRESRGLAPLGCLDLVLRGGNRCISKDYLENLESHQT